MNTPVIKLDELAATYLQLRAKKAEMKKHYEDQVADIDRVMDKMEAVFLKQFDTLGVESVKTDAGTVYASTRSSASVADWDAFFNGYVVPNGAWELLEHRANKKAVEQHQAANGELPPGINWSVERTIGVRSPRS